MPHPDPELLVLAALPAEPDDPVVAAHLRECATCRAEVADLRRTVELARDAIGDAPAPPPHVWEGIAAELGLSGGRNGQVHGPEATDGWRLDGVAFDGSPRTVDAPDPTSADDGDTPPDDATAVGPGARGTSTDEPAGGRPATTRGARPPGRASTGGAGPVRPGSRRSSGLRRIVVPLLAAAVGLVVGLGVGRAVAPDPQPAPVAGPVGRLAPVGDLDPAATGTVAMADDDGQRQMVVQVQGVTNIASGDHLEAWLMDASGTRLVPLGALAGSDGDFRGTFAVPDGLPLGEFGLVDVSAERWDGNPGHSTVSLLRGDCCS